jgi:hypothetical protein
VISLDKLAMFIDRHACNGPQRDIGIVVRMPVGSDAREDAL